MTWTVKHEGVKARFSEDFSTPDRLGGIRTQLSKGRFYELGMLKYIASLQVPGVYLDVGACIGTHSVFFAQHCPAELVYAYEPREHIREELDANIALNKLQKKIIVEPWAVSDKVETFTLRLLQRDHEVESRRLDDLHEKVAVIKIDVEGMETAVLDGAERLLRESRPVVFAEARTDPERDTLDACFAKYDYKATGRVFNATPTYEYVAV